MSAPALEARKIVKAFGALRDLSQVDAAFLTGEIHAVLGENGAGKSTLMNVLAGYLTPDEGTVEVEGEPVALGDPRAMRRRGVALVHQHFMLVPEFSVLDNLTLDHLDSRIGLAPRSQVRTHAEALASHVGWIFDFSARTGGLPVGVQQRVEILKALLTDPKILILDEPTAVLSPDEIENLFTVLRQLRDQGRAVILIAHKLSEIFAIADRVTVLRRGEVAGRGLIGDVDVEALSTWMVGDLLPGLEQAEAQTGEVRVRVAGLTVAGDRGETAVEGATFEVKSGEILGVAGVDGNGQLELAEAIAGIRRPRAGTTECKGRVSYIPQDRRRDGLALDMTIWENLIDPAFARKWINPRAAISAAEELRRRYGIKAENVRDNPRQLSGGNQQKVVVARELSRDPDVIVAMNPTRGLDLNAARFVHQRLREAAAAGAAVLLISTDLDEIAEIAHRRLTISRGRLTEGDVANYLGAKI